MNLLQKAKLRLRSLFSKGRLDAEMDDEMRSHIEMQTQENIDAGMAPEAARYAALKEFGWKERIKEVCREERGTVWFEQFVRDVRHGARVLRNDPGFATIAVLTLALGIGATTAIFSVAYAVVLRPLPFPASERLVAIWTQIPKNERLPMAAANHRELVSRNSVFEDIAILRAAASYNLTGDGEPERLLASSIPSNLFPLLRVRPFLGRGFTKDENEPGRDHVAILSYGLWQRRYAGDSSIIGKTVRLENISYLVVGVMGPDFQYPSRDVQIWTPLTINPEDFQTRTGYGHLTVARLKPGVSLEQAQAEVDLIASQLGQQYPKTNTGMRFNVMSLRQDISGQVRKPLVVLLGAAFGLLLIGCCNLANLFLGRVLARNHEIAVRSALGASRFRLFCQAAAEMLSIEALGGAIGVLAAHWGVKLMIPRLPAALPRVEEIQVNLPVMLFSGAVLFVAACLAVLWPAMQAAHTDPAIALRGNSRTWSGTAGKATIRNLIIVGQVALTLMLLAGAGLLIRTFTALKEIDPGFRAQRTLSLQLAIPRNKYAGDDRVAAVCRHILEQVRALPGVEFAGMGNRLPLAGLSGLSSIEFERNNLEPGTLEATDETTVTPDYFHAMGIPLLQGRSFTEQDTTNAPLAVVVDSEVARRVWPGQNPIGKRVRSGPNGRWGEVVGVVGHVRHESLEQDQRLQIYWNYLQRARDRMTLIVRSSGDARSLIPAVLGAIRAVDPDQPAYAVRTVSEVVDQWLAIRWYNAVVVSLFAVSSLLLAMVGIYGVIAWMVRQRTREIGIRMALGAQKQTILLMVLKNGLRLTGAGTVLGIAGAMMITRFLRSLLFGVDSTDPLTFVAAPLLLICVALLACWLPARRASRVDPMKALRCD